MVLPITWHGLDDRKVCFCSFEGTTFGDVPLSLEYKLEAWDSPNSAGVVIDAIRAAKIALDRGLGGPILAPSAYFMKSPAVQYEDHEARALVEQFITGQVENTVAQLNADIAQAQAEGKDVCTLAQCATRVQGSIRSLSCTFTYTAGVVEKTL